MTKVKASELSRFSKAELEGKLVEFKTELAALRVQKLGGAQSGKLTKIYDVRKNIARVLTVLNLTQREQVREFYKDKKYMPKDLRGKQTRAIRRRLTPAQAAAKTTKATKKQTHFPQRRYALKA
ncbi:60S ribosomal protein [Yarrowia sp. C11]|nr:60S ribosomal protein [Yarrowia sp. E02]KAG5367395.1 60S ribosomal protein [Yarrowia sp. C11]